MRLKQLAERRVAVSVAGDSLRPLSQKEVQQVAGGLYFTDLPVPGMPGPGLPLHPIFPGPEQQAV